MTTYKARLIRYGDDLQGLVFSEGLFLFKVTWELWGASYRDRQQDHELMVMATNPTEALVLATKHGDDVLCSRFEPCMSRANVTVKLIDDMQDILLPPNTEYDPDWEEGSEGKQ